ncbi:MAG TPA: hypothetical protein VHQ21_04135, partial [Rhodanobacteraceae bacterium]|nr:hypothetical protein [Rhodanobacteraceae bacterium]
MPRIPVPTVQQNVGANGPLQVPVASGAQLGDYAGQADQQLGGALEHSASVFAKIQDDQAITEADKTFSQFQLQQFQKFKDAQTTSGPGAQDFTKNYIQSYDNDAQQVLDSASSRQSRKFLARHLETFRTHMGVQSIDFQSHEQYANKENNVTESIQNRGQVIYQSPEMYKDQLDQQTAMIDSLSMPDDFKFKAKKEATRQFTDNYWAARSQIDPQGTKNELSAAVPASLQPQLNGPAG